MSERLFLLDTNIVLALVRGNALARYLDEAFALRTSQTRPLISIVTHGEIRVLASRNGWGKAKMDALQSSRKHMAGAIDIGAPAASSESRVLAG